MASSGSEPSVRVGNGQASCCSFECTPNQIKKDYEAIIFLVANILMFDLEEWWIYFPQWLASPHSLWISLLQHSYNQEIMYMLSMVKFDYSALRLMKIWIVLNI